MTVKRKNQMKETSVKSQKLVLLIDSDVKDKDWRKRMVEYVQRETGQDYKTLESFANNGETEEVKVKLLETCIKAFYQKNAGALAPKQIAPVRPDFTEPVETPPVHKPIEVETEPDPEPAPVTAKPVTDPGAALIESMRQFISNQESKPAVDETAVRKIVAEIVGEQKLPAREVIELRKPDGAVKELTGRRHPVFAKVLKLAQARQNILLVGPAGCGKTTLARHVAEALDLKFGHVSLSQGITEGKLIGKETATGYLEAKPIEFYRDGGVWLWDELDAADSNVLVNWHAAWSNNVVVNGRGECIGRHADNIQIAAANTFGLGADRIYVGRNQLDAATLDRWYAVEMDYDTQLETDMAKHSREAQDLSVWVWIIRAKVKEAKLRVVVSTRWIEKGVAALGAGIPIAEIKQDLTAHMKADERKAVGL